jgi:phosphoglucosamine mutase
MRAYFGTDGIRGKAGVFPLDRVTIARIGYLLARELGGSGTRIIIGRDTRESGGWIEAALAGGLRASGAEVASAGVITTPGVAYLTRLEGASAGVVISASHNPYDDNGIKVFAPSGRKLDDATELRIERGLEAETFPALEPATIDPDPALRERYFAFLRDEIGARLDLAPLRLVIDCANGAASDLAPRLFAALGATVMAINNAPDGRNINLESGSLHPEGLARRVTIERADLGIAFDGDADRLLLVDAAGRFVDGDQVLYVIAVDLAARGALDGGRVVATVMSNLGLELALRARGIALARTAVGDKYVLEELLAGGGSIGGEQSGHIIFPAISLAGDGMITALEVLRVMTSRDAPLGVLLDGFTRCPQIIVNVQVARKPPFEGVAPIRAAIESLEREMEGAGRLLVRYSGTENLARIMIEGADASTIRRQADALAEVIHSELG